MSQPVRSSCFSQQIVIKVINREDRSYLTSTFSHCSPFISLQSLKRCGSLNIRTVSLYPSWTRALPSVSSGFIVIVTSSAPSVCKVGLNCWRMISFIALAIVPYGPKMVCDQFLHYNDFFSFECGSITMLSSLQTFVILRCRRCTWAL